MGGKEKQGKPMGERSKALGLWRGCGATLTDPLYLHPGVYYTWRLGILRMHLEALLQNRGQSQKVGFLSSLPTLVRACFQMFYKLEFPAMGHLKKNIPDLEM